ncbi:MAG: hypothetical protein LBL33_05735 [Tannerella sp.]|jgi:hypothetical protein|nr:hypothetical protein [Tannerella sp.]
MRKQIVFILTVAMVECFSIRAFSQELLKWEGILQTMIRVNEYFMQKYADCMQPSDMGKLHSSNIRTCGVYYKGLMVLHRIYFHTEYYDYTLKCAESHWWGLRNGYVTHNAGENGSALTTEQKQAMQNPGYQGKQSHRYFTAFVSGGSTVQSRKPDDSETFSLPVSPFTEIKKPDGN